MNVLEAYYFSFDSTGNEKVDSLLATIVAAGNQYPNTEDWNSACSDSDAPIDWIQDAANELADYINNLV